MSDPLSEQRLVSVDEYLGTSYRPDVDFVDGLLVERNLGDRWHSALQAWLCGYFNMTLRARYGKKFSAFAEFRMETRARTRYRIPDVLILPSGVRSGTRFLQVAPWIAIELKSPDDTVPELIVRCQEYVKRGSPYVWLIHPQERTVMVVDAEGGHPHPDRRMKVELNGETIIVDLNEVFAELDEI